MGAPESWGHRGHCVCQPMPPQSPPDILAHPTGAYGLSLPSPVGPVPHLSDVMARSRSLRMPPAQISDLKALRGRAALCHMREKKRKQKTHCWNGYSKCFCYPSGVCEKVAMELAFQRPEAWGPGVDLGASRTIPLLDRVDTLSCLVHQEKAGSETLADGQN